MLGYPEAASERFEQAITLGGETAYARNNLCHAALMRGDEPRAMAECGMALVIDPSFAAARNNLGLIHAAAGRWTEAADAFRAAAGDEAVGQYNLGVAYASRGEYGLAADAFEAAATLRPAFDQARQRAREARRMAEGQGPPDRKR